jgi:hypothetical protein
MRLLPSTTTARGVKIAPSKEHKKYERNTTENMNFRSETCPEDHSLSDRLTHTCTYLPMFSTRFYVPNQEGCTAP